MNGNFQELKNRVKQDRATKDMLLNKTGDLTLKKTNLERTLDFAEKARLILQDVS